MYKIFEKFIFNNLTYKTVLKLIIFCVIILTFYSYYIEKRSEYKNCKKKYSIALVSDYYKTFVGKMNFKITFYIGERKYIKKINGYMSNQFMLLPENYKELGSAYYNYKYFLIEICPKNDKSFLIFFNKKVSNQFGKRLFGKEIDSSKMNLYQ